jgi:putative ABC transport system permease protein
MLTDSLYRLRALFRPSLQERELGEEFQFHLEMETRKLVAEGLSQEAALREARRRFGNLTYEKERTRDAWGIRMIRDALSDAKLALRQFARRPGFTFLAVATLALGVGATVALFSVVRGLLLRPLPYTQEEQLHQFYSPYDWTGVEYDFLRERIKGFESLGTFSMEGVTLTNEGGSVLLLSNVVSANIFDLLGVRPLMGRTFKEGEDRPGAEPVVVLGWGTWQQEFGGDREILGKRIVLAGVTSTVIGVMPRGFYFPSPDVRIWQPLNLDPASNIYNNNGWLVLVGRARAGMSSAQLHDEVQLLARDLGQRFTYPDAWNRSKDAFVTPLRESMVGDVKPALLLLLGAVTLLLLMACVNAAALILARTTDRTSEIVLRTALGAGRGRLARQILVESLTLSLIAGAAGALLAVGLFRTLVASLPLQNGFGEALSMDWITFVVAIGLAMLVGLGVSAIPIRHLLLGRLSGVSGERGDSIAKGGASRAHAALVTAEVTLAVLLVAGAMLLVRSVSRLYALDPGFESRGVVTVDLITSPEQMNATVRRDFYRRVLDRAALLPGVQSAGMTNRLPVRDRGWQGPVRVEGRPDLEGNQRPTGVYRYNTPDYFRTLGMEVKLGRGIEAGDREGGQKVVVISEGFARKMWPNQDPLGRHIWSGVAGDTSALTVVGVVEETRMFSMTGENPMVTYLAHEQVRDPGEGITLVLRTSGEPGAVIAGVRGLVRELDPRVAVARPGTMEDVVKTALAEPLRLRFFLTLFGGLALVLGTVGVYGVVSYSVARRRGEFGIRMALGAAPGKVLSHVVVRGMLPVAIGVGVGIAGAIAMSRILGRFLYEVAPTDAVSLGASGIALLTAGVLAALVPAWRAGKVSPVEALRAE